jgi:ribonuclease P protein component
MTSGQRGPRKRHETTVSTFEDSPETAARLSEPQFQQERASHPAQPTPRRPQTAHSGLGLVIVDASPPAPLGLPRTRRIKQGRDFARARTQGRRLTQGCLILNWISLPHGTASRVGVITGRRIGEAVTRTRARRLLREVFRLNQPHLNQSVDAVLVARPSIAGKRLGDVAVDFVAALKKARLYREDSTGANRAQGLL